MRGVTWAVAPYRSIQRPLSTRCIMNMCITGPTKEIPPKVSFHYISNQQYNVNIHIYKRLEFNIHNVTTRVCSIKVLQSGSMIIQVVEGEGNHQSTCPPPPISLIMIPSHSETIHNLQMNLEF